MEYRYKDLKGDIALPVEELVRQTYEAFEIRIISGVICRGHAHIFVSALRSFMREGTLIRENLVLARYSQTQFGDPDSQSTMKWKGLLGVGKVSMEL